MLVWYTHRRATVPEERPTIVAPRQVSPHLVHTWRARDPNDLTRLQSVENTGLHTRVEIERRIAAVERWLLVVQESSNVGRISCVTTQQAMPTEDPDVPRLCSSTCFLRNRLRFDRRPGDHLLLLVIAHYHAVRQNGSDVALESPPRPSLRNNKPRITRRGTGAEGAEQQQGSCPQKEQRDHYTTLSIGFALKIDEPLVHLVEALLQLVVVFRNRLADVGFDVVSHRSEPGVQ